MAVRMEIGNIDLPTVMYFTAECEAYHPFEAPFFVGLFFLCSGYFLRSGIDAHNAKKTELKNPLEI